MKKNLMFAAAFAATAVLMAGGTTVYAKTAETSDGVAQIELPDETWKEVSDPQRWAIFSNGYDAVAMLHYSNGEELPAVAEADETYEWVYEKVISNKNEVFVFLGLSEKEDHFDAVKKAVDSIEIKQYNTKKAVKSSKNIDKSSFKIEEMNKTVYVAVDTLNVRAGHTTEDYIIGELDYGDAVQVTGQVVIDGAGTEWYRVALNGSVGYIYGEFVSDQQPSAQKEEPKKQTTEGSETDGNKVPGGEPLSRDEGEELILYRADGSTFGIYPYTDGYYYDGDGEAYEISGGSGDMWKRLSDGEKFTTYDPNDTTIVVTDESTGESNTLTRGEDGLYYDKNQMSYFHREDGAWVDENGKEWY
ncbi:MAG: SH3 domain-containing protein [Clostridia bacterium]|nr:SH3 domain-containing protein [Clostridia bacterium]MDY5555116.1 SH3 domain-containing protein [Blautia sp.]